MLNSVPEGSLLILDEAYGFTLAGTLPHLAGQRE